MDNFFALFRPVHHAFFAHIAIIASPVFAWSFELDIF
jgi:hypothetical protein